MKKHFPYLFILLSVVCIFFWKFFINGLLPIPADTIVGLYHPFRDAYRTNYPNGIPYKNFLITDPVRQQYPWKELGIQLMKSGQWPLWNPYSGVGMPLLGNLQSALLYPLNIFLFLLPFKLGWSILVFLQPLLAGLFLYAYLIKLNVRREASLFGAIAFAFSGFFIAWLEWNTVVHVVVWLPLILLSIEKILHWFNGGSISNIKNQKLKIQIKDKKQILFWGFIFLFSLTSSFFAGHLQIFFYLFVFTFFYFVTVLHRSVTRRTLLILFSGLVFVFLLFTSIQWLPTLKFISLSAREFDQADWQRDGWFIPWQHLIQFVSPDFFGNPTTLNYWGVWNYAEMVGYVGILPLIFALFALSFRKDKKTLFFGIIFFLSLIFAVPTWFAKLPYRLQIPLISTSQPTRLLFLIDFSLAVLSAFGLDYFLRRKSKMIQTIKLLGVIGTVYLTLLIVVLAGKQWFSTEEWIVNLIVSKRNLILPISLFATSSSLLLFFDFLRDSERFQKLKKFAIYGLFFLTSFDLLRFGWKFTPFVDSNYLFPTTSAISFLQKQSKPFRIMATDKRILPPNFSSVFRIESVDVYDPLFLKSYGELVSAWQRGSAGGELINFNRMITPQDFESRLADLLNVKYVLSLNELTSSKLTKVFEEGETKIYENKDVYLRAFLVESVISVADDKGAIAALFKPEVDLRKQAIVENAPVIETNKLTKDENAEIITYSENETVIKTNTMHNRFLVLADSYYPTWKAYIDGKETIIYRTDFTLRGVVVPKGQHMIVFSVGL